MTMNNIELLKDGDARMDKAVEHYKSELQSMRAGRANPKLLDRINVDYYGTPTPLAQVGNVSAPEPRMLMISPWDASIIGEIEKAIMTSDIGINPMNDGKVIRLVIPELTEERRKDLVKSIHQYGEEAKVAIRGVRHDAKKHLEKLEKDHEVTEDDLRRDEKNLQEMTNKHTKTIEDLTKAKEKEILAV